MWLLSKGLICLSILSLNNSPLAFCLFCLKLTMKRKSRRNQRSRGRKTFPGLQASPVSVIRDTNLITVPAADSSPATVGVPWSTLPLTSFATFTIKLTSVQIEAVSATPGGCLSVALYDRDGAAKTESRRIMLGSTVVRFVVRQPPSTDFGVVETTSNDYVIFTNTSTVPISLTVISNFAVRSL